MNRKQTVLAVLVTALFVLAIGATWVVAQNDGVIHACANPAGQPRIVSSEADCRRNETHLNWNITGPMGPQGPQGEQGPPGPQGEQGPPGIVTKPDGACFDLENRYVDCGNGTVTDTATGIIWLKRADCFGFNNWVDANNAVAALESGDCDLTDNSSPGDWRLPTHTEWVTTVAEGGFNVTWAIGVQYDYPYVTSTSHPNPANSWCLYLPSEVWTACYKVGTVPSIWPVRSTQ